MLDEAARSRIWVSSFSLSSVVLPRAHDPSFSSIHNRFSRDGYCRYIFALKISNRLQRLSISLRRHGQRETDRADTFLPLPSLLLPPLCFRSHLSFKSRSYAMDGGKHTVRPLYLLVFSSWAHFMDFFCFSNHVVQVAAIVSTSFLEFSKRAGNDLSTPRPDYGFPGLQEGCRWCLCVERWKEAFQAKGRFGDDIVPK